ncbi:hypothetical protein [Brevundimonas sp.]|uniref:hypothetical protein n=1 Tax=Brevundimonas sp. TaxID=1871086 RepID=UPI00289973C9|nr:hypothetical protein [Brevundimonas sp.]
MSLRTITSIVDVAAPGLGSVFGELVNVVLPANREERMAQFVTKLDLRLKALSVQLGTLLHNLDAEQLALIEDGLRRIRARYPRSQDRAYLKYCSRRHRVGSHSEQKAGDPRLAFEPE